MTDSKRKSESVSENGVESETYVDGDGPAFVVLPSYGRDGGEDYDDIHRAGRRGGLEGPAPAAWTPK